MNDYGYWHDDSCYVEFERTTSYGETVRDWYLDCACEKKYMWK